MKADIVSAVNIWRLQQTPVMEPNDAILELLRRALTAEGVLASEAANPIAKIEQARNGFLSTLRASNEA